MKSVNTRLGRGAFIAVIAAFVTALLTLLPLAPAGAASGWERQRQELIESHFMDVFFLPGGSEGYAVGSPSITPDGSAVYDCWHTDNGGTTWTPQLVGADPFLNFASMHSVYFRDANLGYAAGEAGLIAKYDTGTWSVVYSAGLGSRYDVFFDVFAPSPTEVWAVGANIPEADPNHWTPIVLKSDNAGVNWHTIDLNDTFFYDSSVGWAVGDGGAIIYTGDGGTTWALQTSGTTQDLNAVYALDTQEAWVAGSGGTVLHSENGGTTWESDFGSDCVFALDASNVWVGGKGGDILYYNGASWTAQDSGVNNDITGIHFINASYGWACGSGNTTLFTTNGGTAWAAGPALAGDLKDVFVYDDSGGSGNYLIWVCGDGGVLAYTTDAAPGGAPVAWSLPATAPPVDMTGIEFKDAQNGEVVGSGGTIAYSINGGAFWAPAAGTGAVNFTDVAYSNTGSIWFATAENGGVWQSRDGTNWGPFTFYDVAIPATTTSYYCGGGGALVKWSLGTWSVQDPGTSENLKALEFLNASWGMAVGEDSTIVYTDNGGTNWTANAPGTVTDWNDVSIVEDGGTNYICVVGDGGNVIHNTYTGGVFSGWMGPALQPGGVPDLYAVDFFSADVGWALGVDGTVWQTLNGKAAQPTWSEVHLNDVFSLGTDDTYFVGDGGTIIHWNAQTLTADIQYNALGWTTEDLRSVYFRDADNGWAVGDNGTVVNCSSGTWGTPSQVGGGNPNLNSVFLDASDAGYAVGDSGYYVEYTGAAWQAPAQVGGANPNLDSVYLTSHTAGYAVGDGGYYVQLAGGLWAAPAQVGGANPNLNSIYLSASDAGYAVGDGGYYVQLAGGLWAVPAQVGGANPNLNDLDRPTSTDGYAVGGNGTEGYVVPINSGVFGSPASIGAGTGDLTGVALFPNGSGFASGLDRTVASCNVSAAGWVVDFGLTSTTDDFLGFDLSASQSGCATGENGTVYGLGGGLFKKIDVGTTKDFNAVSMPDAAHIWAVGEDGYFAYYDGGWGLGQFGYQNDLFGVEFLNSSYGATAGEGRTLYWTDNGAGGWSFYSGIFPTTDDFLALDFLGASDGWLCGELGLLYRYQDGRMNALASGTGRDLNGITMFGGPTGYAVGDSRTVVTTADGTSWNTISTLATSEQLNGASFTSAGQGWFAGSAGTILHYGGGLFTPQDVGGTTEDYTGISLVENGVNDLGVAVGTAGTIRYTTDNGQIWSNASPLPGEDLAAVELLDVSSGILCGKDGRVMYTTDGGVSWLAPATAPATSNDLEDVTFGDLANDYAWVVGEDGFIARSEDDGNHWTSQTSGTSADLNGVSAVFWGGNYVCYAVGGTRNIIKSTAAPGNPDAWGALSQVPGPGALLGADFSSSSDFYAVGFEMSTPNGLITHTTNGGVTFATEGIGGPLPPLYGIDVYDAAHVWAAGEDTYGGQTGLVISTNGAPVWSVDAVTPPGAGLKSISVDFDALGGVWPGCAVGTNGTAYYTTDAMNVPGFPWGPSPANPARDSLASVWLDNIGPGINVTWAVGQNGSIVFSGNGGLGWAFVRGPANTLYGLGFADSDNGAACGAKGSIIYTSNGGTNWNAGTVPTSSTLRDVSLFNNGGTYEGVMVGDGPVIFETSDGGATWAVPGGTLPTVENLNAAEIIDMTHAWVAGNAGSVWFSSDGSFTNWTQQADNQTPEDLMDIDFCDATHGIAVGGAAGSVDCVRWTSDGGTTWNTPATPPPGSANVQGVGIGDATHAWAVGDGGQIWCSSDGGDHWTTQSSPTNANLYDVSFGAPGHQDIRNGFIVGTNPASNLPAVVLSTTNGGGNWELGTSNSGLGHALRRLDTMWNAGNYEAFAAGDWGRIQHYTNDVAIPSITPPLTPDEQVVGGSIQIDGANFGADQGGVNGHVFFTGASGDVDAGTATAWGDTQILVNVPSGAYTGPVHVENDGGGSNNVDFEVEPSITNVTPDPMSGGDTVTVTGTGFGNNDPGLGDVVSFNHGLPNEQNVPNGDIVSWTDTQIRFTVPDDFVPGTGQTVTVASYFALSNPFLDVEVRPKITQLNPATGRRNIEITVTGVNFGPDPAAGYDASNCVAMLRVLDPDVGPTAYGMVPQIYINQWTATQIKFRIPSGVDFLPWTGEVRVLRTLSQSASNPTLSVQPNVSGPSVLHAKVGDPVTINGSAFGYSQAQASGVVRINGASAGNIPDPNWGYNQIAGVTVPTNATPAGNVTVQTTGGTSTDVFDFRIDPVLNPLAVSVGRVGDTITLTGSGFGQAQGNGQVTIHGVPATVSSWGASTILVVVPQGATTGNVVVQTDGGQTSPRQFTVLPKITSLDPTSGVPGETVVTIKGYTFGATQGTGKVLFGDVDGGAATAWSANEIKITVPAGASTCTVAVVTADGASNGVQFYAGPYIDTISPDNGPPGIEVTVSGANFGSLQGSGTVTFNGVDAGQAVSWSDDSLVVTVPRGATSGNVVVTTSEGASNGVPFSVGPARTFFFAEGTTRENFAEFLCLQNPNDEATEVTITYMVSDGANQAQVVEVPAKSRLTVRVIDAIGPDKDVSVRIDSIDPIVAERPMYFNYNGVWTGGHDVVGAVAPAKQWYFAEGNTRDEFEEWICLQNPNANQAHVQITYMLQGGGTRTQAIDIPATSRRTLSAKQFLGPGLDCSAVVTSDIEIIAERPMYFDYNNAWTGGHDVVGATAPTTECYFAEGTTRDGFDEWLCLLNPGETLANVQINYMLETGEILTQNASVPTRSRITVNVVSFLGRGRDVSAHLVSDQPIVAERPVYFDYVGITGGSDVIGSESASAAWYFAEGTTQQGFQEWLSILNPGETDADVTITYMLTSGNNIEEFVKVPAHSRVTVDVNGFIGWGKDVSAKVSSLSKIIVERPMYFDYNGWTGGHDVLGFSW